MEDNKKCVLCGLTQSKHKTDMHVFGLQIGCPWPAVKSKISNKTVKKIISPEL